MPLSLPPSGLIVLCGLPRAGKSTYADRFPPSCIVSIDSCHAMVDGKSSWHAHELFYRWIECRLALGLPTVADATALGPYKRRRLIAIARQHRQRVELAIIDTPLAVCQARNARLKEPLSPLVLIRCHAKLELARSAVTGEGWDTITFHLL